MLTRKETTLANILCQQGGYVSLNDIIYKMYPQEEPPWAEANVRVLVYRMRKKGHKIETAWGWGYKLG